MLSPHHRRRREQEQQKPKRNDLFGSGSAMLQLGMKTAVPHLRPPACHAVPARRAPNLRDIGVRYVASDGGGPPSAGPLPAGRRSTPATPPPLGLLSAFLRSDLRDPATPPTYCNFNAADHFESPSARHHGVANMLPPHHRRLSEQQQLGIKMAVPHLRPPARLTVPLLTGGGPSSAGLLPPAGHSLTPATPPAFTASVAPLFNFHGPDARFPAGTPWGSRRGVAPHCSVTRLRQHSQSSMMGNQLTYRSLCTNQDSMIKGINLLSVDKGESDGDEISSGIKDAVEKIAHLEGNIQKLSATELEELVKKHIKEFKINQSQERLKRLYYEKIRPALVARSILSPYPLSDDKGIQILEMYKESMSDVLCLTSLNLMEEITKMTESHWRFFLDFLSEQGCLVFEDWENTLGVSFGSTLYKRGVIFDGSPLYRGECDASFIEDKSNKEKSTASICIAIWTSENEILSSTIVKDFLCEDSIKAEVVAMLLLLTEAVRLGLHEHPFEACSDCQLVFNVQWGTHRIDPDDKNTDLLNLIKYMRSYFKTLIPEWQPREKMFWVDGVMRAMKLTDSSEKVDLRYLLRKMKNYLSGKPVFKVAQKQGSFNNLIYKIREESRHASPPLDFHTKVQLQVEENNKVDMLSRIVSTMRPSRIAIVIKNSQSESRTKIFKMFEDCKISEVEVSGKYGIVFLNVKHRNIFQTSKKLLRIIFDSSIPEELFQETKLDSLTVFLKTPSEVADGIDLPELSPLSFISFHNTPMVEKKRSPHPNTKWSQKSDNLLLVIEMPEAKDIMLDLKPEGHFHFCAKGADDMPYKLDLELFDYINIEEIKKIVGPQDVRYLLKKANSNFWPRLLKTKDKPPFLKIDSKLDVRAAASETQNDENQVVNKGDEVRSDNKANEDVGGSKVEHSKREEAPTGAAKEEKP